jgi:hypothetical protein
VPEKGRVAAGNGTRDEAWEDWVATFSWEPALVSSPFESRSSIRWGRAASRTPSRSGSPLRTGPVDTMTHSSSGDKMAVQDVSVPHSCPKGQETRLRSHAGQRAVKNR